jgi:hypothetical protein
MVVYSMELGGNQRGTHWGESVVLDIDDDSNRWTGEITLRRPVWLRVMVGFIEQDTYNAKFDLSDFSGESTLSEQALGYITECDSKNYDNSP